MGQTSIYTIGYGAREMDDFLAVLKRFGIAYLVDVRSRPYSRYKPDFSKKALEAHVKAHGIRYVFMGKSLGGQPGDPTCYTDGKVDYGKVREKGFYLQGIGRLQEAYRQQLPIALMCSEGKPEQCHRSMLIGRTLVEQGVEVIHIDENERPITQEDVLRRRTKGQPSLFGEGFHTFTSRKRYDATADASEEDGN